MAITDTASPKRTQQIPHHVTALLSHLTSRPGVQSTLILSRKDGSIIQTTGLLASQAPEENGVSPATEQSSDSFPSCPAPAAPPPSSSYQPSQAEALAVHIFAFVSSASALGVSLSRPVTQQTGDDRDSVSTAWDDAHDGYGDGMRTPREEDRDAEGNDRDEEGEVKLLRMRTRKHEIVVVPDRKYLLCVVHDAAHSAGGPGAAGARSSR